MHYTISYKDLTPEAAHAKAIEDIKFYLSAKKYEQVLKAAKEDAQVGNLTRRYFIQSLGMLAGIQGFPAVRFAVEVFGEPDYAKPADLHDHFIMDSWGDDEAMVPFTDVKYYEDQIFALHDNMGKPILREQAHTLAIRLAEHDTLVARKPDPN